MFLGVQLSGKSTFAKKIAETQKISRVSIDEVRFLLYGHLSCPKDWTDNDSVLLHNEETRKAYDILFGFIKTYLDLGWSLVVEMPHLGDREEALMEIVKESNADLKIVWCYILQDSDEEIQKRINSRSSDSAPVRLEDYRMFKSRIKKPILSECFEIDTSQQQEISLELITRYLEF